MIFTRNDIEPQTVQFGEESIRSTTAVKWLGIHLNPQLTYKQHISNLNNKANLTLAQINRISTKYFVLHTANTRLLIKTTLYHRLLYGGSLWINERNKGKIGNMLTLINNKAAQLVMGVQKSTPLAFLKRDSGLGSLLKKHITQTHKMVMKLMSKEEEHPGMRIAHQEIREIQHQYNSEIHLLINRQSLCRKLLVHPQRIRNYPVPR
ncbi:hypothetical protein O181_118921 [Austropuccinia psidii MF-1]|uniref:Uncharacterized protein n=1 Tax=Austropuccinia psidii MF-1 TaxID=1389203 RepID=A0A9Q3KFH6_9BASI|nr:hypothetical protein [Austropuccinia psidii MF-1]